MIDRELASLWRDEQPWQRHAMRWRWMREAAAAGVQRSLRVLGCEGRLDSARFAGCFYDWAAAMEPDLRFADVDPLDHAQFSAGALLHCLMKQPPLFVSSTAAAGEPALHAWRAWPEAAVLTRLSLTLASAWRQSLGAAALTLDPQATTPSHVASYFENLREDPAIAGAFVDSFTGVSPAWRFPTQVHARPAMQQALADRGAALAG